MQKLKRNINMGFRVTAEEQEQIMKRMNEIGFPSVRAYLLKMALNGMIVQLDLTEVRECSRLLRNISNNVNQLAKRANEYGNVPTAEIVDVKSQLGEIWEQQNKIIKSLTKILGANPTSRRRVFRWRLRSTQSAGSAGTANMT